MEIGEGEEGEPFFRARLRQDFLLGRKWKFMLMEIFERASSFLHALLFLHFR